MPGHPLPLSAEDRRSQTGRMLLRLIELHEPRPTAWLLHWAER
jgi:hypothetical protein